MPPKKKNSSTHCTSGDAGLCRLADVKAAESELRRRRLLLQRQQQRLRHFVADVAFILFVWAAPDTKLCAAYLQSQQLEGDACGCTVDEVQQRYLQVEVAEMNAISEKQKTIGQRKLDEATRFQREFTLAQWIEHENSKKGNAPTVALVQSHLSQGVRIAGTDKVASCHCAPADVSTKWVQRFRKRWHLTRGRFAARERVPLDALREKASVGYWLIEN